MQVNSSGSPAIADQADDLASFDLISSLDQEAIKVGKISSISIAMIDSDKIAVITIVSRLGDDTGRCCKNLFAALGADIET